MMLFLHIFYEETESKSTLLSEREQYPRGHMMALERRRLFYT